MKPALSRRLFCSSLGLLLFVASCSSGTPTPRTTVPLDPNAPRVTLELGSEGDALKWNVTELRAAAGSRILLRLRNSANPNIEMQHNWVLTEPGTEDAVGNDGVMTGPRNSYVREADSRVIAFTKLIRGGESTEIEFMAPKPGRYPFICTFPGHVMLMKGVLIIN